MIYGILAAIYGVLISIQSAFCANLTESYGNWFSTVTVHLSGFLVLTPFFLAKRKPKAGGVPWYLHLGGVIGIGNVVFSNYGIVHLGLTNSNMLMLLGEICFAAILDCFGWMGIRRRRITPAKCGAIAVMLLGAVSIILLSGQSAVRFSFLAVGASLMRGIIIVIFRQVNGQLGVRAGTGYATYMNYVTGLAASTVIFAVLGFPMQTAFPAADVPVWTYFCGAIGCCGIFLCNIASPRLSALTMSLVAFLSQTVTGIIFDLLWGTLSVPTMIGCAIVCAGMLINLYAERSGQKVISSKK